MRELEAGNTSFLMRFNPLATTIHPRQRGSGLHHQKTDEASKPQILETPSNSPGRRSKTANGASILRKSKPIHTSHLNDIDSEGSGKANLMCIFEMPDGTISVQTGRIYLDDGGITDEAYHDALRMTRIWTATAHYGDEQAQFWYRTWQDIQMYINGESDRSPQRSKDETETEREELINYIDIYARNVDALTKMDVLDMNIYENGYAVLTYDHASMP